MAFLKKNQSEPTVEDLATLDAATSASAVDVSPADMVSDLAEKKSRRSAKKASKKDSKKSPEATEASDSGKGKPRRRRKGEAAASADALDDSKKKSDPRVPPVSFNMMTVRYAIEQRRSLTVIVLVGVIAIAAVLLMTRWIALTSTANDIEQATSSLQEESVLLNTQLTELADTGGLNPNEVNRLLTTRLEALKTVLVGKIDYQRVVADLKAFDSSRAWVTSVNFSEPSATGVTINVAGSAVNRIDADNWRATINASLGYGSIEDPWVQTSGSEGALSWNLIIHTDESVYLNRFTPLGFSDISPVPAATPDSETGDGSGETTETTIPTTGDGE